MSTEFIPYGRHYIDEEDISAVVDVLRNGSLTQGPVIEEFEEAVASYVGAKYAVAVSSCTAGLHLAALAAKVDSTNKLVTSPVTFVSSANAAHFAGSSVLFADIDERTLNISPSRVAEILMENMDVRAIVPVHFAGMPCNVKEIRNHADTVGAVIIEDAAHALGASYPDGQKVGSCADSLMTVFSFHPVKLIASGEGGMITTNNEAVYRRLLRLRSHGINKSYDTLERNDLAMTGGVQNPWYYEMQELGYHYRITDIQCALGLSQFKKLDRFLARRRELVARYDDTFFGHSLISPTQLEGRAESGHHLYVVRINYKEARISRAALMNKMKEAGIITQVHYVPVPLQPFYKKNGHDANKCPVALKYYDEALSLPLFYDLSDEQQDLVIRELIACVGA